MSSWYCLHVIPSCITLHTIQLTCLQISHRNWFTSSSYKHQPLQSGVRQWKLFEECSAWLILFCKCFSSSSSDSSYNKPLIAKIRISHSEVSLKKGVLKICSKFTGEHSCWSVISIKLQSEIYTLQDRINQCN